MATDIFIHPTTIVDEGASIGAGTKIWHFCHIQLGAVIGSDTVIGQNVYVGRNVIIGDRCKIQNNVSIYEGVTLEDEVFCGPSCVFTNDLFPRANNQDSWQISPTLVKHGASIGANATIVCGHTIGEYAMIGSGATVTHDVPAYALMIGAPARHAGWVCECGAKLPESLVCDKCQKSYNKIKPEEIRRINA